MNDSADQGRLRRFALASWLIFLPLTMAWQAAKAQGISPVLAVIAPIGYLLAAGILIAMIVSRLYALHEIRKLKFDTLVIILATCLAALPLALSNILWDVYELQQSTQMKDSKLIFTVIISGVAVFLLLPLLYVAEALISWTKPFWPRRGDQSGA